jgi:hypothetical protein
MVASQSQAFNDGEQKNIYKNISDWTIQVQSP